MSPIEKSYIQANYERKLVVNTVKKYLFYYGLRDSLKMIMGYYLVLFTFVVSSTVTLARGIT